MQRIPIPIKLTLALATMIFLATRPASLGEDNYTGPDEPADYGENPCGECKKLEGEDCVTDPEQEGNDCEESGKICCDGECQTAGPPDCCNPCKDAEDNGLFKPKSNGYVAVGAVICCNGNKYICLFPQNAPPNLNTRAKEGYMDCVREHEEEHFNDPDITCPEAGSHTKVTNPKSKEKHVNNSEWQAYSNTIDCLQSKIDDLQKELEEIYNMSKDRSERQLEDMKNQTEKLEMKTILIQNKRFNIRLIIFLSFSFPSLILAENYPFDHTSKEAVRNYVPEKIWVLTSILTSFF